MKGFFFVGGAEAAAEVKDGIVVVQGEGAEEFLQLLEAVPDLGRVGFVGLGIGLVKLIQDGGMFLVAGVQGMGLNVGSKALQKLFHSGTSKKFW